MFLQRWTGDHRPQWAVCYVIAQSRERNALARSLQTPDRTGSGSEALSCADRCVYASGKAPGGSPFAAPCPPRPLLLMSQKSKPIPDCPITCSPQQTWVMRRGAPAESTRRNKPNGGWKWVSTLALTTIRVSERNGTIQWAPCWPCHVTPRLPSSVVGSYMTPMSTVTGRFTASWCHSRGHVSKAEAHSALPLCPHPSFIFLSILYSLLFHPFLLFLCSYFSIL